MNFDNDEEALDFINRLLERLHQAGFQQQGSNFQLVYVAKGAQYVNNQYNQQPPPASRPKEKECSGNDPEPPFNTDTPLSALFRENHREKLREVIESWRPNLANDNQSTDALGLTSFEFNLEQTRPVCIYMDLARLIIRDALCVPMSVLAAYMFGHSNLSRSQKALYVQLKRYTGMCK